MAMDAHRTCAAVAGLLLGMAVAGAAVAQKQGGILRVQHRDSPASMSILEEGTISAIMPMMGVFNNLVLFDQHVPQNRVQSIVPELATAWAWSEDGTELSFKLRDGVKWHGLSNGGAPVTSRVALPFIGFTSQIACGAWVLTSFNNGIETS
jgi:ABC-type transport system substrate-binding protein